MCRIRFHVQMRLAGLNTPAAKLCKQYTGQRRGVGPSPGHLWSMKAHLKGWTRHSGVRVGGTIQRGSYNERMALSELKTRESAGRVCGIF